MASNGFGSWINVCRIAAFASLIAVSGIASAAQVPNPQAEEEIAALKARVAELERIVSALMQNSAQKPDAQAKPAEAAPQATKAEDNTEAERVAALESQVRQMADSATRKQDFGIPMHGFAEVGAGWSGGGKDPGPVVLRGFSAGGLEFYMTPNYERLRSLFELRFEYGKGDGSVGVDLERAQIGYQLMDNNVLWFGRFHIPYGYWNTAFHHGAFIQTAVTRPRFIDFEDAGGVLPTHAVGAWYAGKYPTSAGSLAYDLFVANGGRIVGDGTDSGGGLDFNGYTDDNYTKMYGGRLAWQFTDRLDGLELGVHGFHDTIDTYGDGDPNNNSGNILNQSSVTMGGAYGAYVTDSLELIGEWYHISSDTRLIAVGPGTLGTHQSDLWFVQGAYTIGSWQPYARVEQAALNADDPLFSSNEFGRPYRRGSLGLRYNINSRAALKLDLSRTHEDRNAALDFSTDGTIAAGTPVNYSRLMTQLAIRF